MRQLTERAGRHPWVVGLVVLIVGHAVFVMTRTYGTGGDWAFIELRTSDVLSSRPPLTGAWSRYGWNHPGPLMYWLLALPYTLLGGWRGLWLGAMLLNVAAIVVAAWLLVPHRRALSMVFPIAALWAVASGTPHLFTDPWNASLVVVPVITMVAATTVVLLDDRRGLAVAAVVFVAAGQTHAAYGLLLLPMMLAVLVIGVRRWWRYTLVWIGVGALLCVPILIDTLVHWPGNLYESLRFTMTSDEPARGVVEAVRVIGRATSLSSITDPRLPSFLSIVERPAWGVLPGAALLAIGGAWTMAHRRAWHAERAALTSVSLMWLGGLVMVARTRGPLLIWLTSWVAAACAITWALVAVVAARWLLARASVGGERTVRVGLLATAVAGVSLAVVNVSGSVGVGYPFHDLHPVVVQFAGDAEPVMAESMPIDLAGDDYVAGAVQSGLIAELEARGHHPLARPDQGLQMGARRAAPTLDTSHLLVNVETISGAPDGAVEVSVWDPLTDAERAEADALVAELTAVLSAAGLDDRVSLLDNELADLAAIDAPPEVTAHTAGFARLAELRRAGPRIVLYQLG